LKSASIDRSQTGSVLLGAVFLLTSMVFLFLDKFVFAGVFFAVYLALGRGDRLKELK
jgi:hypothetical protein